MHNITELPAWERLLKRIAWQQLGAMQGKKILDFGSGEGITANYYARENCVVAIEPSEEMVKNRWADYEYTQVVGDITQLADMDDNTFDLVICHNVLEYVDNKNEVLSELYRVLKTDGILSVIKHNRAGRVMQMGVLLDDTEKAHSLLDGNDSIALKFGAIRYYEDEDIHKWVPGLQIMKVYGIRTFWGLQQHQDRHGEEEWQEKMTELEMRVSEMDEYRNIAFFHHLLFSKS